MFCAIFINTHIRFLFCCPKKVEDHNDSNGDWNHVDIAKLSKITYNQSSNCQFLPSSITYFYFGIQVNCFDWKLFQLSHFLSKNSWFCIECERKRTLFEMRKASFRLQRTSFWIVNKVSFYRSHGHQCSNHHT